MTTEIIAKLNEISKKVTELDKKLAVMDERLLPLCDKQIDHEKRIREVEKYLPIMGIVMGGITALTVAYVLKVV